MTDSLSQIPHDSMRSPRSGFSLIEIMIAIVILTIGLLALASGLGTSTRWHQLVTNRAEMVHVGDSQLEVLRLAAAARTADTMKLAIGGSLTTSVANHADTTTSPGGITCIRRWEVIAGPAGTRRITLRVIPEPDGNRTPQQMNFTSLILVL